MCKFFFLFFSFCCVFLNSFYFVWYVQSNHSPKWTRRRKTYWGCNRGHVATCVSYPDCGCTQSGHSYGLGHKGRRVSKARGLKVCSYRFFLSFFSFWSLDIVRLRLPFVLAGNGATTFNVGFKNESIRIWLPLFLIVSKRNNAFSTRSRSRNVKQT